MINKNITIEDVKKASVLCKLTISEEEAEKLKKLFEDTLEHIAVLDELDTSNIEETYQVSGLTDVFQKDGLNTNTLPIEKVLQNALEKEKNMFVTKGVFDRE